MSRAATSIGTKRRSEIEVGQLLQAARGVTPELSRRPKKQQLDLVADYRDRILKGKPIVGAEPVVG